MQRITPYFIAFLFLILASSDASGQCSSLYNTPEFPIATHPSDQHTNSWGVNLFTPAEFGSSAASLVGIQVYVDNSYGATNYPNQRVYMRHTTTTSYPNANYPGTAGWTHVYSGSYNFPWSGLYTISFNQNNFNYNGVDNVEVLFENRANLYDWNEPWFRRTQSYGAGNYRSKWNGDFGWNSFPGSGSNGSAVRLTYTLSMTAQGGSGCGTILPSGILQFTVHREAKEAVLNWKMEDHLGAGRFEVERSLSPTGKFEDFGGLQEKFSEHEYVLRDRAPLSGESYYRLKYTDNDGLGHYSEVIRFQNVVGAGGLVGLVNSDHSLDLIAELPEAGSYVLRGLDLQGREIHHQTILLDAGRQELRVQNTSISSGILLFELTGMGQRLRTKVFIPE